MGFAGVLRELGLPRSEFLTGLLTFNAGVEARAADDHRPRLAGSLSVDGEPGTLPSADRGARLAAHCAYRSLLDGRAFAGLVARGRSRSSASRSACSRSASSARSPASSRSTTRTNAARRGGGIGEFGAAHRSPDDLVQLELGRACPPRRRFMRSDASAPHASGELISSSGTRAASARERGERRASAGTRCTSASPRHRTGSSARARGSAPSCAAPTTSSRACCRRRGASMNGLTTSAGERCASTWSGPFCASSSSTKIADSFQNLLCEIASTSRPSASVVLGDHRARRRGAGPRAGGVVVAEPEDRERGRLAVLLELGGTPAARRRPACCPGCRDRRAGSRC